MIIKNDELLLWSFQIDPIPHFIFGKVTFWTDEILFFIEKLTVLLEISQ